jgi:Zn-dependent protease
MTLFVLENTDPPRLNKLFTLLDVDVLAAPRARLGVVLMLIIGVAISLITAPVDDLVAQILVGLVFGLMIYASTFVHDVGHIISSRMVHAPMRYLILTTTIPITRYDDADEATIPSRVHVGRSLGGPAANLVLSVAGFVLYALVAHSPFFLFLGFQNAVFFVVVLSPIPTLDGAVILREMRHWKR